MGTVELFWGGLDICTTVTPSSLAGLAPTHSSGESLRGWSSPMG